MTINENKGRAPLYPQKELTTEGVTTEQGAYMLTIG